MSVVSSASPIRSGSSASMSLSRSTAAAPTVRAVPAMADIAAGDKLYWNGSVAQYQLAATDTIDFDYEVDVA